METPLLVAPHKDAPTTSKLYVPEVKFEIVVVVPVPLIAVTVASGLVLLIVHPVDVRFLNETDPVVVVHVDL
jgi:hypothetical protein